MKDRAYRYAAHCWLALREHVAQSNRFKTHCIQLNLQSAHPDCCSHDGTGTFSGILEKLDYLSTLGINALELQPIHEFNELEYYGVSQLPAWTRASVDFWPL